MENHAAKSSITSILVLMTVLIWAVNTPELSFQEVELTQTSTSTLIPDEKPTVTETLPPTKSRTPTSTKTLLEPTDTPEPTETPLDPTQTPTFREMLKQRIVFYLIQPEKGRQDACGNISLIPIISKRMRSGDKLQDVQVALNMLFNLKSKIYIQWYNALWDTGLTIDSYDYNAQKDYMTIHFAGYLPAGRLSNCDKHGIREQIWTTFFHYGIKEKTFKINGEFLIDELNRKGKK